MPNKFYIFSASQVRMTNVAPYVGDCTEMTYVYQLDDALTEATSWHKTRLYQGKPEFWERCHESVVPAEYKAQLLLLL